MARSIGINSGDGILEAQVIVAIGLPDSGVSVTVEGNIVPVGGSMLPVTGSPLTGPAVPGSGSTFWIIQLNTTTGAASIKTSASSLPTPDAGNVVIFDQTLASTDAGLSQDSTSVTVDQV